MAIEAVLFDFSGTIFRLEDAQFHDADLVHADGRSLDTHEVAAIVRAMTAPVEQFVKLDAEGQYAWEHRDLSPELHRTAYLQVLQRSGVPDHPARQLYERLLDPLAWTPYPDTGEVLEALYDRGFQIAVVSNIAFDVRPAFTGRGWDRYIGDFALSFEVGAMKPDRRIFEHALERLDVRPEHALMIGDSVEADGGATALGCEFALVEPVPTVERPTALRDVLLKYGLLDNPS